MSKHITISPVGWINDFQGYKSAVSSNLLSPSVHSIISAACIVFASDIARAMLECSIFDGSGKIFFGCQHILPANCLAKKKKRKLQIKRVRTNERNRFLDQYFVTGFLGRFVSNY